MKYFTPRIDSEDLESAALQQLLLHPEQKITKRSSTRQSISAPTMFEDNDYYAARDASIRRQKSLLTGFSIALSIIALLELGIALPAVWNGNSLWPFSPPSHDQQYPRFLVIGDWGRQGHDNQSVVADSMAIKSKSFKPHFIVSTGDNFYESGLVSVNDPSFNESFIGIYHHDELQVPWHVVLGNHDYGEVDEPQKKPDNCGSNSNSNSNSDNTIDNTNNSDDSNKGGSSMIDECFYSPIHQLDVRLTQRDPRWHCERSFTQHYANGAVEMFYIDTTPIMSQYKDEKWAINRGGFLQQSWEDQIRELESRLARSTAQWKIVVGHHPIRSNHRPDHKFIDMVDVVEPLLIKYNVDAYLCGHDHNLQYIYNNHRKYHHITSGAGSQIGSGFFGDKDSPFQYAGNGFVAISFVKGNRVMRVEYIGVDGGDEPLYVVDIEKNQ